MKTTDKSLQNGAATDSAHKVNGNLSPVTARGEATRRKILDAAEEVFGEMGYYEGSVSEITRRAGVAQGTFYLYFHTKKDIFAELVMDIGKRLRADSSAAIANAPDRLTAEKEGFKAFFAFVKRHRNVYNIVQEAERVAPEAAKEYYQRFSEGYQRGLQIAIDQGEFRRLDTETVGYALMGMAHFLALRWILWPWQGNESSALEVPESVLHEIMAFLRHGLIP